MLDDLNFWFNYIYFDDMVVIFFSLVMLFVEDQKIYEYCFCIYDGSYLWMYDILCLICDVEGMLLEVIGLMIDIIGCKQMEDILQCQVEEQCVLIEQFKMVQVQLMQFEKLVFIGQLVVGVVYEINNLIGFVNVNFNILGNYVVMLFEGIKLYQCVINGSLFFSVVQLEVQVFEDCVDL